MEVQLAEHIRLMWVLEVSVDVLEVEMVWELNLDKHSLYDDGCGDVLSGLTTMCSFENSHFTKIFA